MALSWILFFAVVLFSFVICPSIVFLTHLKRIQNPKVVASS